MMTSLTWLLQAASETTCLFLLYCQLIRTFSDEPFTTSLHHSSNYLVAGILWGIREHKLIKSLLQNEQHILVVEDQAMRVFNAFFLYLLVLIYFILFSFDLRSLKFFVEISNSNNMIIMCIIWCYVRQSVFLTWRKYFVWNLYKT